LDDRYGGVHAVASHDGRVADAIPVDSSAQIARQVSSLADVIAIDEAQFLDHGVITLVTSLAGSGVRVLIAGTDTDFRGEPFGPMGDLMAVSELVDKLHAICVICGNPASRNQRLIGGRPASYDSPTIMVGGSESYEARCRHCHQVPRHDEQRTLL
jgi:thymidine kinase